MLESSIPNPPQMSDSEKPGVDSEIRIWKDVYFMEFFPDKNKWDRPRLCLGHEFVKKTIHPRSYWCQLGYAKWHKFEDLDKFTKVNSEIR